MRSDERIEIELEIDVATTASSALLETGSWSGQVLDRDGNPCPVTVEVVSEEDGHGFGISELVTVAVSVAAAAASDLVAEAVKQAVGGIIRRVRARSSSRTAGGSTEEIAQAVDEERKATPDGGAV